MNGLVQRQGHHNTHRPLADSIELSAKEGTSPLFFNLKKIDFATLSLNQHTQWIASYDTKKIFFKFMGSVFFRHGIKLLIWFEWPLSLGRFKQHSPDSIVAFFLR